MQEMATSSYLRNNQISVKRVDINPFSLVWTKWHTGAVFGLAGGFLATVVGLILTTSTWLAGHNIDNSLTGQIGTWLMIVMIPLLMLGAYCLDKIETTGKMIKEQLRKRRKCD